MFCCGQRDCSHVPLADKGAVPMFCLRTKGLLLCFALRVYGCEKNRKAVSPYSWPVFFITNYLEELYLIPQFTDCRNQKRYIRSSGSDSSDDSPYISLTRFAVCCTSSFVGWKTERRGTAAGLIDLDHSYSPWCFCNPVHIRLSGFPISLSHPCLTFWYHYPWYCIICQQYRKSSVILCGKNVYTAQIDAYTEWIILKWNSKIHKSRFKHIKYLLYCEQTVLQKWAFMCIPSAAFACFVRIAEVRSSLLFQKLCACIWVETQNSNKYVRIRNCVWLKLY